MTIKVWPTNYFLKICAHKCCLLFMDMGSKLYVFIGLSTRVLGGFDITCTIWLKQIHHRILRMLLGILRNNLLLHTWNLSLRVSIHISCNIQPYRIQYCIRSYIRHVLHVRILNRNIGHGTLGHATNRGHWVCQTSRIRHSSWLNVILGILR